MIQISYGDEDQNDLMRMIKDHKGEEIMENDKIYEIERDIQSYREAIANAEGALDEAERELAEELEKRYGSQE